VIGAERDQVAAAFAQDHDRMDRVDRAVRGFDTADVLRDTKLADRLAERAGDDEPLEVRLDRGDVHVSCESCLH
jgi:hypothetical protein